MRILIAPDSFKDSLSSESASESMARGIKKSYPHSVLIFCPMADGGEGTSKALVRATNGEMVYTIVHDPLMRKKEAFFGVSGDGKTAVVEVASASGLELLSKEERNPLHTTSYGTGELILQALEKGYRKFIIGLGGSAVNDCGAGILVALGAGLYDQSGNKVFPSGEEIGKVAEVDFSAMDSRVYESQFCVACDVNNPLTGPNGASMVFGPQKGASPEMVQILDANLAHFAGMLKIKTGIDADRIPGAGAAGGIGAVMVSVLKAEMKKGFELIAEASHLDEKVQHADLVITGEGRTDWQTLSGKVPYGICQLGKKYGKPVLVFCGQVGEGGDKLLSYGASEIYQISDKSIETEELIRNASFYLEKAVAEKLPEWIAKVKK